MWPAGAAFSTGRSLGDRIFFSVKEQPLKGKPPLLGKFDWTDRDSGWDPKFGKIDLLGMNAEPAGLAGSRYQLFS